LPAGAVIDAASLPAETKWVLTLGETSLENFTGSVITGSGFTLHELSDRIGANDAKDAIEDR
jgi:hypothetical protein